MLARNCLIAEPEQLAWAAGTVDDDVTTRRKPGGGTPGVAARVDND